MAPLSVVVVDDEALARSNLTILLRRDPAIGPITECESGPEALAAIRRLRPRLAFLDVQMPGCNGFDLLELLGSEAPPVVVFVTAYDTFALRAFDAGALDYLLKPFDDARFYRALERAKMRIAAAGDPDSQPARRLIVRNHGQVSFIKVDDIDWVEAAGYYACLHVAADTHIIRRTLTELERDLGETRFVRIHRSTIVNLDRVHGLELGESGDYEVVLTSHARLRLSRRFRKRLQSRMGSMLVHR